jgi:hypothetical protein
MQVSRTSVAYSRQNAEINLQLGIAYYKANNTICKIHSPRPPTRSEWFIINNCECMNGDDK